MLHRLPTAPRPIAGALVLACLAALPAGCASTDQTADPGPNGAARTADTEQPDNDTALPDEPQTDETQDAAPGRLDRITLAGGLIIEDLREGQGPFLPPAGETATVTVHYLGRIAATRPAHESHDAATDGLVFDSTYDRGEPVTLEFDRLIRGWRKGLPGMRIGGLRRLTIPPELAYGPEGHLNVPGSATVVYEVLLLGFSPQAN